MPLDSVSFMPSKQYSYEVIFVSFNGFTYDIDVAC